MMYNWQQPGWPQFNYDQQSIDDILFAFAEETGHLAGLLKAVPENIQSEAIINMMVSEAIKTSEIEGEYFSREDVVSSIRNNLGLNEKPVNIRDKKAQGAGELMVVVRNTFMDPLTEESLFSWHRILLAQPSGINVGVWRTHTKPMQVISGSIGKETIHFEAPPSAKVPAEMQQFISWFNDTAPGGNNEIKKAPVRSAIAHLYFESIHPFEDGNGRIGRALAEKAISQTIGRPVLISLSQIIEADKKSYYLALKKAQVTNDITAWMNFFINIIFDAHLHAKSLIEFIINRAKFFDRFKDQLNERQLKVIRKMLDAGPNGFEGGMTANKYISITKTSKATATRDLQNLTDLKVLLNKGGGRNTHYLLNMA